MRALVLILQHGAEAAAGAGGAGAGGPAQQAQVQQVQVQQVQAALRSLGERLAPALSEGMQAAALRAGLVGSPLPEMAGRAPPPAGAPDAAPVAPLRLHPQALSFYARVATIRLSSQLSASRGAQGAAALADPVVIDVLHAAVAALAAAATAATAATAAAEPPATPPPPPPLPLPHAQLLLLLWHSLPPLERGGVGCRVSAALAAAAHLPQSRRPAGWRGATLRLAQLLDYMVAHGRASAPPGLAARLDARRAAARRQPLEPPPAAAARRRRRRARLPPWLLRRRQWGGRGRVVAGGPRQRVAGAPLRAARAPPLPSASAAAEAAAAAAVARRVRSRPLAAGSAFALDSAVVDCLVALLAAAMSGGAAARDRCGASDAQLFLVAWRLLGAAPAAHRIPAPPPFAGAAAGAEAVGHALDAARISVASLEASATSAASSAASSALAASVGWMRAAATGLGPRRCRDAASHADGGGGGGGCRGGARHRFVRRPG